MSYIGKEPIVGNYIKLDAISVVNGQAAYTMQSAGVSFNPETAQNMIVSLNGVIQAPISSYTISGSTITFASNLATGDVIDFIVVLGDALSIGTPSDSTVNSAKLTGNLIFTPVTSSSSGSVTLDFATGNNFTITLTGNITSLAVNNEVAGQTGVITFVQDGTGGRTVSLSAGDFETASGGGSPAITLSSTANAVDIVPYYCRASGGIVLGTPILAVG